MGPGSFVWAAGGYSFPGGLFIARNPSEVPFMWEVIELVAAWVRERGAWKVAAFLVFVVLPILAAVTIIGARIIY